MKNEKLKMLGALATGALLIGSTDASASNLFSVEDLGSGAELRTELSELNALTPALVPNGDIELKCGEGTCGEGSGESSETEASTENSETKPETKIKTEAATESKEGEHKCGEGKCGEGKCGSH